MEGAGLGKVRAKPRVCWLDAVMARRARTKQNTKNDIGFIF